MHFSEKGWTKVDTLLTNGYKGYFFLFQWNDGVVKPYITIENGYDGIPVPKTDNCIAYPYSGNPGITKEMALEAWEDEFMPRKKKTKAATASVKEPKIDAVKLGVATKLLAGMLANPNNKEAKYTMMDQAVNLAENLIEGCKE